MSGGVGADSWMDLAALTIAAVGGWGTAYITSHFSSRKHVTAVNKSVDAVEAKLAGVEEQVVNSHETNLRDDVDRAVRGVEYLVDRFADAMRDLRGIREEMSDLRKEVGGLHGDVREQNRRHAALYDRVTDLEDRRP